jgi:hypothetical protein
MSQHYKGPVHARRTLRAWAKDGFVEIFLPVGFPGSVTDDFVRLHSLRFEFDVLGFGFSTRYRTLRGRSGRNPVADDSQAALLLANRAVLQGNRLLW